MWIQAFSPILISHPSKKLAPGKEDNSSRTFFPLGHWFADVKFGSSINFSVWAWLSYVEDSSLLDNRPVSFTLWAAKSSRPVPWKLTSVCDVKAPHRLTSKLIKSNSSYSYFFGLKLRQIRLLFHDCVVQFLIVTESSNLSKVSSWCLKIRLIWWYSENRNLLEENVWTIYYIIYNVCVVILYSVFPELVLDIWSGKYFCSLIALCSFKRHRSFCTLKRLIILWVKVLE